jgi:hypothetical protein
VHQGTTAQLAAKPGSLEVTQLESPRKKNSTPKPNPKPGTTEKPAGKNIKRMFLSQGTGSLVPNLHLQTLSSSAE